MVNKINNIFLPEKDRATMRKSTKFRDSNFYWNVGRFNYIQNVGALSYIISDAFTNWQKSNKYDKIMDKKYFVYWYIRTGKSRREAKRNNKDFDMDIDGKKGRMIEEIYSLSQRFKTFTNIKRKELFLDDVEAFNYTIIRVFDETYDGFLREIKTINSIKKLYPDKNIEFFPSSIDIDVFYSIDYIMKIGSKKIGLQIKPQKYCYSHNDNYKVVNSKKILKFLDDYNIETAIAFADMSGNIVNINEFRANFERMMSL